jgi:hypothetical protein
MTDRIYSAIILNEPYAEYVRTGKKTIETRMRRMIPDGYIIICCDKGKSKRSSNAGKAICLVKVVGCRPMKDEDVVAACIENVPGRYAFPLQNLFHFSYNFSFTDYAVTKNWQGIFRLRLPDFVNLIPITPHTQTK